MKIKNLLFSCLALLGLGLAMPAQAQDCGCCEGFGYCFDDIYLRAGYKSARGIGRDPGYATIGAFYIPQASCEGPVPYIDVRLHYLDDKQWALNSGAGLQYALECGALLRGYVFYDYRQRHHRKFDQVAVGFERIGPEFDIRGNAYIPVTRHKNLKEFTFLYPGGYFVRQKDRILSFNGFDFEVSHAFDICDWLCFYGTVGTYYYYPHDEHKRGHGNRNKDAFGGKVRFETLIYQGLVAGVETTYDERFQTCVSGEISWTFPFPGCCSDPCNAYCAYPVRRQELIVTQRNCYTQKNY